jgi:hypothetical protein
VKSGWFLDPTNFGGSVPLHGESSSDDVGWLPVLVVPNSSMPSDAMVKNHLFQLGRSAFKVRVRFDILLKTATKDYILRQGGDRLRSGRRRRQRAGGYYKDLDVISFSFEGVLISWTVITKVYPPKFIHEI